MEIKCSIQIPSLLNKNYIFHANHFLYISDQLKGLDHIWFIGDNFLKRYFYSHFMTLRESYTRNRYEISSTAGGEKNPSAMSRIHNCLCHMMKDKVYLPKLIVFIIEDDPIINGPLAYTGAGETDMFDRAFSWLAREVRKTIDIYKAYLPDKCKRIENPHTLWILPTKHINYRNKERRGKLSYCMETVAKIHPDTSALSLKQIWDDNNENFYIRHTRNYSNEGITAYWKAVDRTIMYCDTKLERNTVNMAKCRSFERNKSKPDDYRPSTSSRSTPRTSTPKIGHEERRWKLPRIEDVLKRRDNS